MDNKKVVFSISLEMIVIGDSLPYNIYVNSSSLESKERFVKIIKEGAIVQQNDIVELKRKYQVLYVREDERGKYLRSLANSEQFTDNKKTEIIKDSAIRYLSRVFDDKNEFSTELLNKTIEGCRDSVEALVDVVSDYNIDALKSLIGSLSYHDFYTFDHSINVSMYCIMIFKTLKPKASKQELTLAGLSGLLHDLGKIKIPNNIINSPDKLTDEQFSEIKKHPGYGLELLSSTECDCGVDLNIVAQVVYQHHENYNGTGYPNSLRGEDIHIMARITAIADFFDAITTKRSYHEVMSIDDALSVMEKTKGKKIDPKIFDLFVKNVSKIIKGNSNIEIAEDFDPCQPHRILPFEKINKIVNEKETDFGKIKIKEDGLFGKKKVS